MASFRPCALIPTFDNPATIGAAVEQVSRHVADVLVVDDGSGPEARAAIDELARRGACTVVRRAHNGGKGAAVMTGFAAARRLGFTHALQVDADLQHTVDDAPRFLEAARARPDAVVLGAPVFDDTAPKARLMGRKLTVACVHLETGGRVITDAMCGFRVYPLAAVAGILSPGPRMDFDIEIAVRLVWKGVPVINLPTKVRYVTRAEGGVSHFRMLEDNARITWLHVRLITWGVLRHLFREAPALAARIEAAPAKRPRRAPVRAALHRQAAAALAAHVRGDEGEVRLA